MFSSYVLNGKERYKSKVWGLGFGPAAIWGQDPGSGVWGSGFGVGGQEWEMGGGGNIEHQQLLGNQK